MKACLDPNVAVISPSLETRFLTGVALSAAVGYFLSTGEFVDVSPELVEGIDESLPATESVLQDVLGGFASVLQGLKVIEDEGVETFIEGESSLDAEIILQIVKKTMISILEALGLLRFL